MSEQTTAPKRKRFTEIDATAFQHPLDRQATDQLKKLYGFDALVAKFLELRYERLLYVVNIASSVRVGRKQFPRLYDMLLEGCLILDVPEPELYVSQQPLVNALTFGHTKPYIMLYTGLLDLMSDDEIRTVIAHELGHVKCGHVLYSSMANSIRDVIALAGQMTLGIGSLLGMGIEAALIDWRRRSELSADRAALLVMQDTRPVISTLTKLAGGTRQWADQLDPDQFLEQARQYGVEIEQGIAERLYRALANIYQGNHPFAVERVKELDEWAASAEYGDILAGNYTRGVKKIKITVQSS
ncbi:MAG: M48 family metallopeptidase [Anaerolineae bacterium]|nr:M48 family metallopeptidase [Anaerolineae bacterium]